jgi:broad specificity phosphatase PhoE
MRCGNNYKRSAAKRNTWIIGRTMNRLPDHIIIGRHGRTVSNRDGRIMGGSDSVVTPDGMETISDLSRIIKEAGVGRIFSSPLGRAALTSSLYSQRLAVPIHFRTSLSELSAGSWEGLCRASVRGNLSTIRSTWLEKPPGGESYHDAESRVLSFLEELSSRSSYGVPLVIGHGGLNRVLLKLILMLDPSTAMQIWSPHELMYRISNGKDVGYINSTGQSGQGLLLERD